jgi:hypothetical protein
MTSSKHAQRTSEEELRRGKKFDNDKSNEDLDREK